MQTEFIIKQIFAGGQTAYQPKQNAVACLVGLAVDQFKQPYCLVEVEEQTANIGSINALNEFVGHYPHFEKITVKDAASPLGDENRLILNRIEP